MNVNDAEIQLQYSFIHPEEMLRECHRGLN